MENKPIGNGKIVEELTDLFCSSVFIRGMELEPYKADLYSAIIATVDFLKGKEVKYIGADLKQHTIAPDSEDVNAISDMICSLIDIRGIDMTIHKEKFNELSNKIIRLSNGSVVHYYSDLNQENASIKYGNKEKFLELVTDVDTHSIEKAQQRKKDRLWIKKAAEIANLVVEELNFRQYSFDKFSEISGIDIETVNLIVKGKCNIDLETIMKIQNSLGLTIIHPDLKWRY